jgi:methylated-DNA-protein-cysteine methyltransferase related protein
VRAIPTGRVLTYGDVALLVGAPRAARVVGGALHLLADDNDVPWHRVVNRQGRISTRCPEHSMTRQAALLRAEGVAVDDTLTLDLALYRWWPDPATLATWRLAPEVVHALDALGQQRAGPARRAAAYTTPRRTPRRREAPDGRGTRPPAQ